MNRRVASRYAMALMGLAEERSILDRIADDLRAFVETVSGSHELKTVLSNPVVAPDRKLALLTELFGKQFDAVTMSFIALIVGKGRAEFLLPSFEEYLDLLDTKRNVLRAKIISAVTLTGEEQKLVQAKLETITGKKIRAEFQLDPALRGGFVARIGDRLIDASLAHQLEMLREQFKRGGAAIMN